MCSLGFAKMNRFFPVETALFPQRMCVGIKRNINECDSVCGCDFTIHILPVSAINTIVKIHLFNKSQIPIETHSFWCQQSSKHSMELWEIFMNISSISLCLHTNQNEIQRNWLLYECYIKLRKLSYKNFWCFIIIFQYMPTCPSIYL